MKETILIVDDDEALRDELSTSLEEFNVVQAADGIEALRLIRGPNEIDLVLLDFRLPGSQGTEVLKRIKEREPTIPVVMLTGHSSKELAIESLRGKADEYLEKPIDVEYLRRTIARLLDRRDARPTDESGMSGKVVQVKHFLERNCFKKVTLEDCAAAVALSPKYLSKVFEEISGSSFIAYKLKIRIDRAKDLLKNTELSVSQISDKFAFQNPESFMRIFKKYVGKTPSKYRSANRKRKWRRRSS